MTAAAPLDRDSDATPLPAASEEELLDVLYEVLAQGVPPRSSLTREEVERFLHEHARERKPLAEMVRFFERHSLPTHASLYGADHALGELASGLQRERGSIAPGLLAAEPAPPPVPSATDTGAVRALTHGAEELTGRHAASKARPASSSGPLLGIALTVVVALVLLGGFVFSYERATGLEQRLEQARMQQRSTDAALTKLEQQAESLKRALAQSESERRFVTTRFEAMMAEEKQKRATEEAALERVLGPRYRTQRDKLTRDAVTARP